MQYLIYAIVLMVWIPVMLVIVSIASFMGFRVLEVSYEAVVFVKNKFFDGERGEKV